MFPQGIAPTLIICRVALGFSRSDSEWRMTRMTPGLDTPVFASPPKTSEGSEAPMHLALNAIVLAQSLGLEQTVFRNLGNSAGSGSAKGGSVMERDGDMSDSDKPL